MLILEHLLRKMNTVGSGHGHVGKAFSHTSTPLLEQRTVNVFLVLIDVPHGSVTHFVYKRFDHELFRGEMIDRESDRLVFGDEGPCQA